jgi:hypothetical protein
MGTVNDSRDHGAFKTEGIASLGRWILRLVGELQGCRPEKYTLRGLADEVFLEIDAAAMPSRQWPMRFEAIGKMLETGARFELAVAECSSAALPDLATRSLVENEVPVDTTRLERASPGFADRCSTS